MNVESALTERPVDRLLSACRKDLSSVVLHPMGSAQAQIAMSEAMRAYGAPADLSPSVRTSPPSPRDDRGTSLSV